MIINTAPVDILTRYPVPRHRLSRRDYYRLGEAGILGEDDRVEPWKGNWSICHQLGRATQSLPKT